MNVRMEFGISVSSHTKDCVRCVRVRRVISPRKMPMIDSRCTKTDGRQWCVSFSCCLAIDCSRNRQRETTYTGGFIRVLVDLKNQLAQTPRSKTNVAHDLSQTFSCESWNILNLGLFIQQYSTKTIEETSVL